MFNHFLKGNLGLYRVHHVILRICVRAYILRFRRDLWVEINIYLKINLPKMASDFGLKDSCFILQQFWVKKLAIDLKHV